MSDPLGSNPNQNETEFRFAKVIPAVKFCTSSGTDDIGDTVDKHFVIQVNMSEKDEWNFGLLDQG